MKKWNGRDNENYLEISVRLLSDSLALRRHPDVKLCDCLLISNCTSCIPDGLWEWYVGKSIHTAGETETSFLSPLIFSLKPWFYWNKHPWKQLILFKIRQSYYWQDCCHNKQNQFLVLHYVYIEFILEKNTGLLSQFLHNFFFLFCWPCFSEAK